MESVRLTVEKANEIAKSRRYRRVTENEVLQMVIEMSVVISPLLRALVEESQDEC